MKEPDEGKRRTCYRQDPEEEEKPAWANGGKGDIHQQKQSQPADCGQD
jgi:hypothetical protein